MHNWAIIFENCKQYFSYSRSGRESYGDSAVGYVQLKRENDLCMVRARICPEHRVRLKPYHVICNINEVRQEINQLECMDCAASAGGCKHAIAFLMWLHRRSEEAAPTAVECYWRKPVLSQIGGTMKFIKAVDIGKRVKKTSTSTVRTDNFLEEVVEIGVKHNAVCPLLIHNTQPRDFKKLSVHQMILNFTKTGSPQTADNFITFCCNGMSDEDIASACILSHNQSESSLWYELRYGRITASKLYDAAVCKTSDGVLTNQIMGIAKKFQTKQMKRGIDLEKSVIAQLEKERHIVIETTGFTVIKKYGILGASPDGVTADAVVEIKCPASENAFSRYINSKGEVTKTFLTQINLQMMARNVTKGIFCVAAPDFENSKKITTVDVKYDAEFTEHIINCAIDFWKSYVYPLLIDSCK